MTTTWTGSWVADRLGITLHDGDSSSGLSVSELVGVAVRDNPRRVQLLVSTVLGKHVPTDPRIVYGAGRLLGIRVAEHLGAVPPGTTGGLAGHLSAALHGSMADAAGFRDAVCAVAPDVAAVVLGNAETATGLGHSVADALGAADYLHSTRRPVAGLSLVGEYAEPHSHATGHLLQPADPAFFDRAEPLVIVDDELSTGATALNTIAALHARSPRDDYVIACLLDLRGPADRANFDAVAERLGTRITVASLAAGRVEVPDGAVAAAQDLFAQRPPVAASSAGAAAPVTVELPWPLGLAEGGRHGFTPHDRRRFEAALPAMARRLAGLLGDGLVHVLGTEEFMYLPLRIAERLADLTGHPVRSSTTTRSPALAVDRLGYPIRTALRFPSHDAPFDGPGARFAYNVGGSGRVVLITDGPATTPELTDGLLAELHAVSPRPIVASIPAAAPLPQPLRGPAFGSYAPDEVGWLLQDLSAVPLEAPTEEREEAIQAGGAHYAESLPVEYQPTPAYQQLFHTALAESATRVAHAVGVVTELALRERGTNAVLVSLARAGTPIGILMRRWAREQHGLELPHYAVSIVRGRGIDRVALRYLAARHDSADVLFVDGWTGKGAITRELTAAIEAHNAESGTRFDPGLAVLADPGECVSMFGTREDYLIPSACLNSTVSGLVSRTVRNDRLIGPNDFDGAKFYAGLAPADVSAVFLDAVGARFSEVRDTVAVDWPALAASDRAPTWAGWGAVERISTEYGIGHANLVKPGVGETTRVLLRRMPWRILVRADAALPHIRLLAQQRGVPVEEIEDLPYSCVGLIHPRYTRGATGADGVSAS